MAFLDFVSKGKFGPIFGCAFEILSVQGGLVKPCF